MNQQPIFKSKEAFKIVGVERYTGVGISAIQEAWEEFGKRIPEIQHKIEPVTVYGFEDYSHDFDLNAGGFPKFYYIAALEVDSLDDIPAGMVGKEVTACHCAVFRYQGPVEGISTFFRYIYDEWLPASGYMLDPRINADFERPQPHGDNGEADEEIWLPVVKNSI